MGRPSAELRIAVPGRTTAEVTAQLQASRGLGAGLHQKLFVKQCRDGSFRLHVPEDRGDNYPVLRATVEDDGGTVLRGVVGETRQARFFTGVIWFMALFMAAMTAAFVTTEVWPNAAVCGAGVVAFVVLNFFRYRLRRPVFDTGVEQLKWAIGRVLQVDPLTTIAAQDTDQRTDPDLECEVSAAMLALADRVDHGASDAECVFQLQNLAGLLRRSVPGDFVSAAEARRTATAMLQQYRDAGPVEREEIRARLRSGDLSQSP